MPTSPVHELIEKIRALEEQLEREIAAKRDELRFQLINSKVQFEQEVLLQHRKLKKRLLPYVFKAELRNLLSAPVIYSLFVVLVLLDVSVSFYQMVCFPLYRIPKVRRCDFFVYDRRHLAYLNILEKINCLYCSYGNGLLSYVKEIVARTEQYWCPIKHASRVRHAHSHYHDFTDFGDAENYARELEKLRCDFRANGQKPPDS
jgi:hypothetical protein